MFLLWACGMTETNVRSSTHLPLVAVTCVLALFALAPASRGEVPLTWDPLGYATVKARVNGQGPFDFVFDTGADESGVYGNFVRRLNLPAGKSTEVSGATGNAKTGTVKIGRLDLDDQQWRDLDAVILPDRPDGGSNLAGVLGYDQMNERLTVIDFACGRAAILPLAADPHTQADSIAGTDAQMINAGGVPGGRQLTLPVKVNGVDGVALLDSGARMTVINRAFAKAAGIDPDDHTFTDTSASGASGAAAPMRSGSIGTVVFAGIQRANVEAKVADLPVFAALGWVDRPVMILGLDLLRPTRLTLDFAAHRLWLAPSACTRTTVMLQEAASN